MTRSTEPARVDPVADALDELAGACLVLDREMRVVLASPRAEKLLGFAIPAGESAPKLLCGEAEERPVAEALAARRPVRALLQRPKSGGSAMTVAVRAMPLGELTQSGSLVLLAEASDADAEGAVDFHGMSTQDAAMKQTFRIIARVAEDAAPVLVRGETGAGKELVARAIHDLSPRRDGPFRAINCAALPPALLESELFGHVRGAFTGAVRDAPGHFQLADKGTLFLDEVAELPLELQAKLLRVLETRAVLPIGARDAVAVDVRIVSATHRALRKEVEGKRFRADLMYRLRVIPIFIPPLRARRGDVRLLTERFIAAFNETHRRRIEHVAPSTWTILETYDWPGNVRELQNVLTYAYATGEGPILSPADLPPELIDPSFSFDEQGSVPINRAPAATTGNGGGEEEARIRRTLERTSGNRSRAARILGMSRVTLWRRMQELGIAEATRAPTDGAAKKKRRP